MNKYIRGLVVVPIGFIKTLFTKVFHPIKFKGVQFAQISPHTEITLSGGMLSIGKGFKMRDGAKIRVRKHAKLVIGKNVSISSNSIIACHDSIVLGDNVELAPNVQIYDHDHDFKDEGGLKTNKFVSSKIKIGNNVWVGANSIILRGSTIGNNVVIAAGSIVKTDIPNNTVFVQKKTSTCLIIK